MDAIHHSGHFDKRSSPLDKILIFWLDTRHRAEFIPHKKDFMGYPDPDQTDEDIVKTVAVIVVIVVAILGFFAYKYFTKN